MAFRVYLFVAQASLMSKFILTASQFLPFPLLLLLLLLFAGRLYTLLYTMLYVLLGYLRLVHDDLSAVDSSQEM